MRTAVLKCASPQGCIIKNHLLISQPKHMVWVLKRTVPMRRVSFEHSKQMTRKYSHTNDQKFIYSGHTCTCMMQVCFRCVFEPMPLEPLLG